MAFFSKAFHNSFGDSKGWGAKLLGAGKGLAGILDEPLVQGAISAFLPEVAPAYGAIKAIGLLEKAKNV